MKEDNKESKVHKLFERQKAHLQYFFEKLDCIQAEKMLSLLFSCKGKIVFSGVGKSGLIAKKIAATFLSTGVKAFFLSPLDALHGDLGLVEKGDMVVFLSKSGKTEELLELSYHIRSKRALLASWVCEKDTELEKRSDHTVLLPCSGELCFYNMVPTTSTSLQLIFGDVMAISLMEKRQFQLDHYSWNHPGGILGKRVSKKVKDLMIEPPLAFMEDRLEDCLREFSEKKCGCLVIVDKKKSLQGIFTDGDLRRALQKDGPSFFYKTCKELMNPVPLSTDPEELAFFALKKMENPIKPIMVLPVIKDSQVVGILRMHDVLQEGLA